MPRLFVAVWPPANVVAELTVLHRKGQRGVRFVRPENWHITLRFLGESDPDEVIAALDQAALKPARARLGPGVDVLAERALVIPVRGLDALATVVAAHTRSIGAPPRRRFTGHLTIARLARGAVMPSILGVLVRHEFEVDEIALVQSRLDPHGAQYQTVFTWPLA